MTPDDQVEIGPTVRLVVGDDPVVDTHGPPHAPFGIRHLRPAGPGRGIMILHQDDSDADSLPELSDRLLWLDGRAGAPLVIASGRTDDLQEAVVIRMPADTVVASDQFQPVAPESLARLIGVSLQDLHGVGTDDCPFESSISQWRAAAAERMDAGLVETAAAGPYIRFSAERLLEVLDELIEAASDVDDSVMIHGMATAAHTWLSPDGAIVFTGWQRSGIGDRHHDLAVAAAALTERYGPGLVPVMLESYGLDRVDPKRLDLHQLLVHLVGLST